MKYRPYIFLLTLITCSCYNSRKNQCLKEGKYPTVDSFNGYNVNHKKSGEYIQYNRGTVKQRDYYLDDSIALSIYYSKGKPLYVQVFENNDIDRQIVFNVKEFNNHFFGLQDNDISDENKGKKLFQYYCLSCHASRSSSNASLEKVKGGTKQLNDLINGLSHPVSFEKMDSTELRCLLSYIKFLNK